MEMLFLGLCLGSGGLILILVTIIIIVLWREWQLLKVAKRESDDD